MFDQALNSHLAALESPPTDDLKSYRAIERPPVRGTYRRYDIPPPSSGGVALIEMLNILGSANRGQYS
jgi:gamma-glutamyltranspeptidase